MRTRRSPRNQEILWRELGGIKKESPAQQIIDQKISFEERILADPFMSKSEKAMARRRLETLRISKAISK